MRLDQLYRKVLPLMKKKFWRVTLIPSRATCSKTKLTRRPSGNDSKTLSQVVYLGKLLKTKSIELNLGVTLKVPKCYLATKLLNSNKVPKTLLFLRQLKKPLSEHRRIEFTQWSLALMADLETFTGKPQKSTELIITSVMVHSWLKV